MKRNWVLVLVVLISGMSLLMAAGSQEAASSTRVAVVTPYMANATTAYVIEQFKSEAEQKGWKVSVSDTAGDFGLLVSRIEDAVAQKVDAIILGMGDPVQMTKGLDAAKEADIPVFGLDAGLVDGVILNITSDNADLGRQTAKVLAEAMGEKGNVVMYTHDPHPGVRARAVGAAEVFDSYPGIKVIQKVHIDVPGPVDNARKITEDLITAKTPMQGIWAGWDEPAYGTTQALDASNVKTVKVVGIDGTDFAKGEIAKNGPFLATIEQDFDTMAATLADVIAEYFAGKKPENNLIQISGNLIR
ncbi:MAG: sugar ABC transporter substrate-binding protein [Sphaerochaetaceae bacterium]|nr:sugar ABC transporter substrate-binding protein [Sphaerochaetaceae bacterium]